jgi:hypothetical protein
VAPMTSRTQLPPGTLPAGAQGLRHHPERTDPTRGPADVTRPQ